MARGSRGPRDGGAGAEVAAHECLDADREQQERERRDQAEGGPVVHAGEGNVIGGPAEPREIRERLQLGDRSPVAVEQESTKHHRAREPRGRSAPEERRQHEGHRPGRERHEPEPGGEAECRERP